MSALGASIGRSDNIINVPGGLVIGSLPAPFAIDAENLLVTGGLSPSYSVERGQNGTAPAAHMAGATVTTGWGGGGGGLTNPLTEALDFAGNDASGVTSISGAAGQTLGLAAAAGAPGSTGRDLSLVAGAGDDGGGTAFLTGGGSGPGAMGGMVAISGGEGNGVGAGGQARLVGGDGGADGQGGMAVVQGGGSGPGQTGAGAYLRGGGGNHGGSPGGEILATGGSSTDIGGSIVLTPGVGDGSTGLVIINGLPSSDPGTPGSLYTLAGVLMVSGA